MKYFDTHAHITNEYFSDKERLEIIKNANSNGVSRILIPGTTKDDSLEILKLNIKGVQVGVGIHPNEAEKGCTDFLEKVDYKKVAAIGEIGLDLYRETNPPIELQKEAFLFQLEIARKNNLPVLVHMRSAEEETYEILSKYKDLKIIMHSFSASKEWADKFIALGAFISFSGIVTFKSAKELKEIAKTIPLERILIETDTPYLTPAPNRGKQNNPDNVRHTGDYIASIREEEEAVVLETIFNNSVKIFGDI